MDKKINYRFFHWGPFLFRTNLTQDELDKIQKLCSKEGKDYRKNLAGLIKNEHEVERENLFPIIEQYWFTIIHTQQRNSRDKVCV